MRSVVVVLPASMCAMMPMLRYCWSGVVRGISADCSSSLLLSETLALSQRAGLQSTKTRVDQASLETGTGIHPPPPGVPALKHGWGPKARQSLSSREIHHVGLATAKP